MRVDFSILNIYGSLILKMERARVGEKKTIFICVLRVCDSRTFPLKKTDKMSITEEMIRKLFVWVSFAWLFNDEMEKSIFY